jgi:hypothetical protein
MESIEFVEKYAILALGVKKEPIPSEVHIQKELFILSNVIPDVQLHFNFEKHYLGPFSRILNNVINAPMFVRNAFAIQKNKITLQESGQTEFEKILKEYTQQPKFTQLLSIMKLIRDIYDRLSNQEILFLVYETYPAFTEYSDISDYLLKNSVVRDRIITSLFSKGAITDQRFRELQEERF